MPLDVFSTLTRTGTIRDTDIIGEQTYVLADGSKSQSVTFTIRSLKAGDIVVENVKGGVSPAQGRSMDHDLKPSRNDCPSSNEPFSGMELSY